MTPSQLRDAFVVDSLFSHGELNLAYVENDRAIIGGAIPAGSPLALSGNKKEMAAEYFTERREVGIINIGAAGMVTTDGARHALSSLDGLYIGRGTKSIVFESSDPGNPAAYYIVSYPAHASYPTTFIPAASVTRAPLGRQEDANVRVINKYIHLDGVRSCQLVMGLTALAPGSVWNTMPPHTHMRRSEVYMYFNLPADAMVVHLMGEPQATRNLILRDREAVISPIWSIHAGAGTRAYSFIWAMGGENQIFDDMDSAPVATLR